MTNRRNIPALGMFPRGKDTLHTEGVAVIPFEESMAREPARGLPHYHDFFQVSLLNGAGRLMHDFREQDVNGLTLFFVSPGQVHTVQPEPGLRGTIASFTREFFDAGGEAVSTFLLELPFYYAGDGRPWLELTKAEARELEPLFKEMQAEHDQARSGVQHMVRSLLRIVFVKAQRIHATRADAQAKGGRAGALVRSFQLAVERHFHEWDALADYARELGVGVNHLNDTVSRATGCAAGEHIRRRRLLSAKRQLLHSELTVAEVGYRMGFRDPSYFGRFFRRYEGVTPAEFRQRSREKYQQAAD